MCTLAQPAVKYRNSEIIQHILIFAWSQVGENILDEFFYWVLIICVSFSRGKLMALHRYFKNKVVLTDPNGNVSSTIHPMVIASMHRERAAGEVEARLPGQLLQVQVLHLTILTD